AVAGFIAFAPDALTPLGGYPGTDDEGKIMQRKLDKKKITEDFIAAAEYLKTLKNCSGNIGVVRFCFGGGMANTMAVRLPYLKAAVPFYGRQPKNTEDVAKIKASLLIHNASLDKRVNAGWPAYEAALKERGINYAAYMYEGANHGFHNDTTSRYDKTAAELAWKRTLAFFKKTLA
ncbi:dienelactone hydrolase family protein, partial [Pseudomonadota bacterium]